MADVEVDSLYDVENRWIGENIFTSSGEHETRFAYDGNQIVLEFDKDRGLSQVRAPSEAGSDETGTVPLGVRDLTHRYPWQPGAVDQLMADEQVHLDANGKIATAELLFALTDQQGTVHDLAKFNSSTGATAVVDHIMRDSFGKVISESDPSQGSLFGYTGKAFDPATGLQNNLNRWYDAKVGRWLSVDPSEFAGRQTNLDVYCGNSPTNAVDPSGLFSDKDPPAFGPKGYFVGGQPEDLAGGDIAQADAFTRALIDLLKYIEKIMGETWIFDLWPNGCERWINAFEANMQADPYHSPIVYEQHVSWEPSSAIGGGHATYVFVLTNGTVIQVDHWIYYGGSRLRVISPKKHGGASGSW